MDSILSKINTENIDTELNHYLNIINEYCCYYYLA